MQKIMNRVDDFVFELCNGIAMTNPEVTVDLRYKTIMKRDRNPDKVTLISGGGSGHEPAHAGFVGKGMLDAAVCGDIFASPTQIQVYKAICETRSEKGTLLIIKNYSGDIMNFKNGAALAEEEGIPVDYVIVSDDIAVKDSLYTVGRRGVAGTVFVHKIAGAAAEEGLSLEEVKKVAQHAADNVRTIGFALSSCTVPAKGTPTFDIRDGEMEYGVGIHGEPGIAREKCLCCSEMAQRMVKSLLDDLEIREGGEIALLINGFGATPLQELYVLANQVRENLCASSVKVYRSFVGNYMTSIDMAGASVSVLRLDDTLKKYLDALSCAPAFRVDGPVREIPYQKIPLSHTSFRDEVFGTEEEWARLQNEKVTVDTVKYMVAQMGNCIISNENHFCEMDSFAGDGDFGASVAKGFRQLRKEWEELKKEETIGGFLKACGIIIMEYCGGASGPIWGSAFWGASQFAGAVKEMDLPGFAGMMQAAVISIQKTGERSFGRGAQKGDKTLIDALVPCADSLSESARKEENFPAAFEAATYAAKEGARSTEQIVARMGRAGVVGKRSLGHPDAGAYALGVIFTYITEKLEV